VTSTNVIDDTAAVSCSTAEYTAIAVARMTVFRPTLSWMSASSAKRRLNQAPAYRVCGKQHAPPGVDAPCILAWRAT
jgi:hypothetical protein